MHRYPAKQSVLRLETSFSTITKNNGFRKVASTIFIHSSITSESSYLAIANVLLSNLTCDPQSLALQHQWKPKNMITVIKGFLITQSVKRAGLLSLKLAHANFKVSVLFLFTCCFATQVGISLSFRPFDRFFITQFYFEFVQGLSCSSPNEPKIQQRINNKKN